jgi:hypothetical protein
MSGGSYREPAQQGRGRVVAKRSMRRMYLSLAFVFAGMTAALCWHLGWNLESFVFRFVLAAGGVLTVLPLLNGLTAWDATVFADGSVRLTWFWREVFLPTGTFDVEYGSWGRTGSTIDCIYVARDGRKFRVPIGVRDDRWAYEEHLESFTEATRRGVEGRDP